MAITPRDDSCPVLNRLASSLLAAGLCAWTTMPVCAEVLLIQPTLSITRSTEKQVNVPGTESANGGGSSTHDLKTVTSPGLQVIAHGSHVLIDGSIRLDFYHYTHGTQINQMIPKGHLATQLVSTETGTGLEAAWKSEQVPIQFISGNSNGNPNNENTKTTWYLAPYLIKQLGADTTLKAKLGQALVHSSAALASNPDSLATTGTVSLAQRAAPFGYELKALNQETKELSQSTNPPKNYSTVLAKGLYALLPELNVGGLIGRENGDFNKESNSIDSYHGHVYGWSMGWQPQERTSLTSQVEHRFFGKAWQVNASHRMTWLAFNAAFSRYTTTYAASASAITASQFDQRFATPNADPTDRAKVLADFVAAGSSQLANAQEINNQNLQLRQEASGRMAFIGRRDTLSLTAGRVDTANVISKEGASSPLSRDYFLTSDWTHRLDTTWRVSNALRWSRQRLFTKDGTGGFGRNFDWRGILMTDLSPQAVASFGLTRQIAHTRLSSDSTNTDSYEGSVFAGLDYKF